jgi:hypothetical protein
VSFDDPYELQPLDDWLTDFKIRTYMGFAARDPRAFVKAVDVPRPMPVIREDSLIPDGDFGYRLAADAVLGIPETVLLPMFNRYGERHLQQFFGVPVPTPLWTRHMAGVQESARDRRRRRRVHHR